MRRPATLFALQIPLLAYVLAGCPVEPVEPAPVPEPEPDLSAELFVADHVLEVDIELAPADWDQLRFQSRSIVDIFGGDCLAQPFADPFTYFAATVTIDGEQLTQVGVRKKGFLGSLNSDKPSLKLKLDQYVDGARFKSLARLTLNNNAQDPSTLRQCLGYQVFARAGVPAPRCNFAHVVVNGEDLGLYTHLESMDKHLIGRFFEDDSGDLWEGTLSDFRDGWTGTFEKKTNEAVIDKARIDAVTIAAGAPDDLLLPALEPLIDVDGFYALWAVESLLGHWDGYAGNTNNFYLYDDPATGKLHFMPWGIDQTFRGDGEDAWPPAAFSVGVLAQRLLNIPAARDRYLERMRGVLDSAWDEGVLLAEVDRMAALIEPLVAPETITAVDEVRLFVEGRRASVTEVLDAGLPPATDPLRAGFCFEVIGDLTTSFSTTWGTLGNDDVFNTGTASMSGTVRGNAITPGQLGSRAGANPEQPGRAGLQVFALLPDESLLVAIFELDEAQVADGVVDLDGERAIGYLIRFVPSTQADELLGIMLGGTLTFSAAGTAPDVPVEGAAASTLYWFPF